MEFHIDQADFDRALASVARVIAAQNVMPILGGIQVTAEGQAVTVMATDLFVTATATVPAEVTKPGMLVLPAALLADLTHRIPTANLAVVTDAEFKATVRYGKNRAVLHSFGEATLPEFDAQGAATTTIVLPSGTFGVLAQQVLYACAKDETRPILRGIALMLAEHRLDAIATDGNRLSVVSIPVDAGRQRAIVMPAKALAEAARLNAEAAVTVILGGNFLRIVTETHTLTARLLDGPYPDVARVIPDEYVTSVIVPREVLRGAVERINLLAALDRSGSLRLQVQPDQLILSATAAEFGQAEETVAATVSGDVLDLAFNPAYLLEAVKSFTGQTIRLAFAGVQAPLQLQDPDAPGYAHYALPLRQLSAMQQVAG